MSKVLRDNLFFVSFFALIVIFWVFRCPIESSPTFSAFFGGSFLLLITAGLIPWYQDNYLNKPDLKIIDAIDARDILSLRKISENTYQLHFAIKNEGRLPIKSLFYWHIVLPIPFSPNYSKTKEDTDQDGYKFSPFMNGTMTKIDGWSSSLIYSKSRLSNFHEFTFIWNSEKPLPKIVYYYFSTEFGYSPSSAYKYDEAFIRSGGKDIQIRHWASVDITL